ncbi:hypothetical protein EPUS_07443 [Endocarpon pusillum Z07020]|uniref:EKC/KEOPS complex subunit BUD32 n=1 Tax=Endocarpon pusillum (strain Z07020 / HMAS-L-300199) TaxID=1263415 RepID=U1GIK4_ENDPU|nr:uncharacterized protein EPUS_07443 [Endocarpon pusillum Z07020]ERF71973.1 hypothetical protein EPUS_07443 [Endocarpon pusillum Z07020]
MTSSFNGDFARLVPRNRASQVLFSETIAYVDKNDTFHLRFMERALAEAYHASSESPEDTTDYDSPHDAIDRDLQLKDIPNSGYYVFSFDKKRAPEMPHIGWRVGRGTSKVPMNRGVDLLLAKPGHPWGKKIASVHLLFRFNLRSGFLVMSAQSQKTLVEVKVGTTWERLAYKGERLIHQPTVLVRAGVCEYELEYTVEEKHREAYFEERMVFLESIQPNKDARAGNFRKLPGDSCVLKGRYLEFETKGYGTFGWVSQGLDTRNGDPVAIKELRLKSRSNRDEALLEVKMGKDFLNKRGLLPILDAWCEHGNSEGCGSPERYYIVMPHALTDLSTNFWTSLRISQVDKLRWLRDLLEGLATLHMMGIIHRDIRPQNMLIMSNSPPRASICDFGKAIKAQTSNFTAIGPISTCAPEVWRVLNFGPYTNKIDTWAFGYAIADILGYSVEKYPGADGLKEANPKITRNRHAAMVQMLLDHSEKRPEDAALVDLALKLLVWDSKLRWSAKQALSHKCWAPILREIGGDRDSREAATEEYQPQAKRVHVIASEADPPAPLHETVPTQEASEETKAMIARLYPKKKG